MLNKQTRGKYGLWGRRKEAVVGNPNSKLTFLFKILFSTYA